MLKLFVSSLPPDTTDQEFVALFSAYGSIRSAKLVRDLFRVSVADLVRWRWKDMRRTAIAALDGKELRGNALKAGEERKHGSRGYRRH